MIPNNVGYSFAYASSQKKTPKPRRIAVRTTISPAFQTTLTAEVVRALDLRPGMMLSQTVEGNLIVLEPLHDVESLAGSLGRNRAQVPLEKMKAGAKAAMARAGSKGLSHA